MKLAIKILESESQIQKSILAALLPECGLFMKKVISNLKNTIPYVVSEGIYKSPEYQSLVSGSLRLEFGIPNANSKIAELIGFWIDHMLFTYNPPIISGNKIKSSFSIEMIQADFSDVLGADAAQVIDFSRGYSLPWLEWLVLDGSKIIVPKYEVIVGPNKNSRTGLALMKASSNNWRVPSEFSGTITDNWITRSIDSVSGDIIDTLEGALS